MLRAAPPGEPAPGYLRLLASGELDARARAAADRLVSCDLCPRRCRVDRAASTEGAACGTGALARVESAFAHLGEEACITGSAGSGTIFFAGCNLRCTFCQNWEISTGDGGRAVDAQGLARIMLALQRTGCHNLNLVSPSHVVAQALAALAIAARDGLHLPIVYNTGGYDSAETLALLDGVVDLYMPDMKYADSDVARRYSHVRDYVAVNRAAVREMHRQVGDLVVGPDGLARRGLLVRHLVLPNGLSGTPEVLRFLAEEISRDTYVNLMDQYRPCHQAREHEPLARRPSPAELREALAAARRAGLRRLDPHSIC
jgi:putative pyruvate formate lyase activating enzyme